ncbi:unnamed protein product [Urochloa decumbens]|uniref:DUF674 family protein n=1 Tax=Urochloa decumbens TaxID=240449 RepID=A0ABC9H2F2_9POAL
MAGAGSAGTGKIRVKFLVDDEKKKVVFAESGKEFVDVLLSFLTLPLGTIVRSLGKESSLGCFDELYKSVESLDESHFQTKRAGTCCLGPSALPGRFARILLSGLTTPNTGIYGFAVSTISCTFHVEYGALKKTSSRDLEIADLTVLEEKTLELGLEEIKILLKQTLKSDKPLTDLMFCPSDESTKTMEPISMAVKASSENRSSSDCDFVKVKLLVTKTDQSVVHAEVAEDFCNILYSFLALPLGHVIKLLGGSSSISSIDNLYKSVEGKMNGYIKSGKCRDMILSPKLPPFFSCSNNFLMTDELLPVKGSTACCTPCIRDCSPLDVFDMKCTHGETKLLAVNPKVPTMTTETGGGYAKAGPSKFLVTNELGMAPLSLINAFVELKRKEQSVSNLVTTEFTFTQVEVLNLLRVALVSREALTLACSPTKPKRRPHHFH